MNRQAQIDLENKFSKVHASKLVKEFFLYHKEQDVFIKLVDVVEEYLTSNELDLDSTELVIDYLVTIVANKDYMSFQALMAKVCHNFECDTYIEKLGHSANVLSLIEASGFVEVTVPRMRELKFVTTTFQLPDYIYKIVGNTAYMPPTVIPFKATSNSDAGWLTQKKSIFLNKNHHDGNAPLQWLNVLNSVAFSIDTQMLNYDEADNIDFDDTKKLENFKNQRELTIRTIKEVLAHGNKFYFIHRFCARYRAYAAGYAISPQGNDYRKALLSLHKKESLKEEYNF